MYQNTKGVCETAVAVNADSSQFPTNWLFEYRWVGIILAIHELR